MIEANLELFKRHVRADDFTEDNEYLQYLLTTAEEAVVKATNRTREELEVIGGGSLPCQLQHAVLMLGAHWYNQRESESAVQMHSVPNSLSSLIKPYRKLA